jgi:hypothetical protein
MKRCLFSFVLVAVAPLATGCGGSDGYSDGYAYDPGYSSPDNILRVDIDTDQTIETDPGEGAGLFVEYAAGGAYHVFSTCDTNRSNFSCEWLVVASIDPTLSLEVAEDGDLEKDDSITRIDKGAVRLRFVSDADFDGAVLTVPEGERLRLNWLLDGFADSTQLTWISGGAVHTGAPSDPLDLLPTSP